jgi:hypothetical protein
MVIGVDFDNTIVCYDRLFHQVCRERDLIPTDVPINKSEVRNWLRRAGREDAWTEMQGYVYGARMHEADPFPGVLEFFTKCRSAGLPVHIISHKTRYPFKGVQYDLHQAALSWLEHHGFFDTSRIGLPRENVFLEFTKGSKLERIAACNCDWFIDDLPEFLAEVGFPTTTRRILFDPGGLYDALPGIVRIQGWSQAWEAIGC